MKDLTGKPIVKGSTITYPTRRGSSLEVNVGIVTDIRREDKSSWSFERPKTVVDVNVTHSTDQYDVPRDVTLSVLERIVVIS